MIELLFSPAAWASLATLTLLEIVLGIDNVVFISVLVSRLPAATARRARQIGFVAGLDLPHPAADGHLLDHRADGAGADGICP
nr:hypothetical protein [uncultured Sphaerochaeta sp.]